MMAMEGSPRRRTSGSAAREAIKGDKLRQDVLTKQTCIEVAPLSPNTATLSDELFAGSKAKTSNANKPLPSICDWDAVPPDFHFVKCNPYIIKGYRVHHTHWYDHILRSFFQIHNETVNVHSHFWAAVGIILLTYWLFTVWPIYLDHAHSYDFIVIGTTSIAFVLAFMGSAFYHLFNCHSHEVYTWSERIDYSGVLLFFSFSLITCFYYGFWCLPNFQYYYTGGVVLFTALTVPLSFMTSSKLIRVSILGIYTVWGSGATLHWVYRMGMSTAEVQLLFPKVWVMWLLLGIAFFFYISKVPERLFPGRINIWLTSHQLWHMFAAGGAFYCLHFMMTAFELRKTTACVAPLY